jgi:tRNA(Ile)-lysidine synthase
VRYRALFEIADHHGVFWIATAHHLQDQAETLLLRLRQGTDWMGLAGIAPRDGRLVRPVLEASREGLRALVDAGGLAPVEDPTNADLARARNFVRHRVLPRLAIAEGRSSRDLAAALSSLARAAVAARDRLAARDLRRPATSSAALDRWLAWQSARRSGVPFPGRAALDAARRKASPTFSGRGGALWRSEPPLPIVPPARTEAHPFSYTFRAPGRVEIVEIGRVLSIEQGREQDWMFGGRSEATGFCLLAGDDPLFLVRSRLPGDRFRPLGSAGSRKLKDVLIDRRVARAERDRIPLLVHAGNIVWVPGVTLAEEHRVRRGDPCWVATLEPLDRRTEVF